LCGIVCANMTCRISFSAYDFPPEFLNSVDSLKNLLTNKKADDEKL
jgi:hypothetical protein